NLAEAEAALQKALELNRNSLEALQTLAGLQLARGETDKAMASYQRYIEANPRDARAYVLLGSLEQHRNNAARAEELYRKALSAQPENPMAANNLAYLLLEQGRDIDVALSLAQIARRGMPDSPVSADTLAWAYYQKGTYRSAVDLLEGAVKTSPDNVEYNFHLGMAYGKLGDKARARTFLEKALRLDTRQARAGEIRKALEDLSKG
ncbi:MAG TPA: tetratricopeptide repeat protein, partial [Terriglobales bacterium]|nr:tetratricopeptide repeat protein [Terriglobales bacterium]